MEVWSGTQRQTRMKDAIVNELGLKPEQVVIHAELIGGSFGRRLEIDYGVEAAKLAHVLDRSVQVLWTRSDDLKFGLYRPGSVHRLRADVDDSGAITRIEHRFAADSVFLQQEPAEISPEGADWTLATPLICFPYEVPNLRFEHHAVKPMAPCAWWRGTYWTNVTTAVECFIDELADAAVQDPLQLRLRHLRSDEKREFVITDKVSMPFDPARLRGVLDAAATGSHWNQPVAAGHARGLACGLYDSPSCYAAVIAEAQLVDGVPRLTSAWVAIDVGIVINPEIVKAQAISGFVLGASAVLHEQITWNAGRIEQGGFEDYSPLRMSECPRIEVILVPTDNGICGVGEIVTPAAMAAVTNAISRLTGTRVRRWPIRQA
jgi:isoquinoline 1-oxidoreductase beta subunit